MYRTPASHEADSGTARSLPFQFPSIGPVARGSGAGQGVGSGGGVSHQTGGSDGGVVVAAGGHVEAGVGAARHGSVGAAAGEGFVAFGAGAVAGVVGVAGSGVGATGATGSDGGGSTEPGRAGKPAFVAAAAVGRGNRLTSERVSAKGVAVVAAEGLAVERTEVRGGTVLGDAAGADAVTGAGSPTPAAALDCTP